MKYLSLLLLFLLAVLCAFYIPHNITAQDHPHAVAAQDHQHRGAMANRWSKEREEMIERNQPSDKIMDAMGIKSGMTVAEVGAGSGRFSVRLAKRVGDAGKVFANDIDPVALEFMRKRCQEENIGNMIVVEGEETDPRLPRGTMDVVTIVNTLHMVNDPVPLMKNIIPTLKPDGILAVIDTDREKFIHMNRDPQGRMPKEHFMKMLTDAGFELMSEETFLPLHFFWLMRPKDR
jgi:ubiquinone/menaquinone biosynthesis C-methylase UbiE